MAIAFNLPSDDDTEARYEVLNRLLLELCDVISNLMMVPGETSRAASRPSSDSSLPRMPDLLLHHGAEQSHRHHQRQGHHQSHQLPRRRICSLQTPPASPSCSIQHLSRTFSEVFDQGHSVAYYGDDEVFCGETITSASNGTTTPTITPGGPARSSLPPRLRRRRRRSSSFKKRNSVTINSVNTTCGEKESNWDSLETTTASCDKQRQREKSDEKDDTDPPAPIVLDKTKEGTEGSLISTLLNTRLGGSIWTAVVLVVGWRLLATKR